MPSKVKTIGEHTVEHLLNVAKDVVDGKTKDSTILDLEAEQRIPKFVLSEFNVGRVLGRGGFCVVSEITNIKLDNSKVPPNPSTGSSSIMQNDEHYIHNIVQDRSFMEKHCIRSGKDCRYAIKRIQDSTMKDDAQLFIHAIVDLAVESRFLSVVRHPNIIKMRAMDLGSPFTTDFFVVLDRLYDILTPRIAKWKKRQAGSLKRSIFDRKGTKKLAFWVERVTVAYDLAGALKYLHDLNVVYRDLKPDNVGFDVRGDVKLFDFGLAMELDPKKRQADGTYSMTGDTGSPRYMAPEVALEKGYNLSVDVYSFSILLWHMLQLEAPFDGFSLKLLTKSVYRGGARPKCDPKWPPEIIDLMKKSWSEDNKQRPTMEEVCDVLREEINKNTDEEIGEILDASRKSEMSAHLTNMQHG